MRVRWRIIDTGSADPFTNMAFDETLLRGYSLHASPPTLRLYGWQPAALSLGYSQDAEYELDLEFCRRAGLPFVRRITGGGIIRHSNELTYSLVCSKEDLGIPEHVLSSYKTISSFLIEFYKRLGLDAKFACDASPGEKLGSASALCFASKEKYDIVVDGRKIGGSAQKRCRDVTFQHGSIPIAGGALEDLSFLRNKKAASTAEPASLEELLNRKVNAAELSGSLIESFKTTFGVTVEAGRLSAGEEKMFKDLKARKYESREWNFDRIDVTASLRAPKGRSNLSVEIACPPAGELISDRRASVAPSELPRNDNPKRPSWLNKKIALRDCAELKTTLAGLDLGTVCEEALCPNIGECFSKGQATFLILGKNCTRRCSFCAVKRGVPHPVDPGEPQRVAEGVKRLGLSHVVITSVTRDDLPDGGAKIFIDTVLALRRLGKPPTIELLIPDFNFNKDAIRKVVDSKPDILAHNIETVKRLYGEAREGADYARSLDVLRFIKDCDSAMPAKSGLMLGLGEREDEVLQTFEDIAGTGCEFLSIGQYLAPSRKHLAVTEYIAPERFDFYKEKALKVGFRRVVSGPYVRSSYLASEYLA